MEREYDALEMEEFAAERRARRGTRCQCGGDMPGICPGPHACPMCQERDEEGDEEDDKP